MMHHGYNLLTVQMHFSPNKIIDLKVNSNWNLFGKILQFSGCYVNKSKQSTTLKSTNRISCTLETIISLGEQKKKNKE